MRPSSPSRICPFTDREVDPASETVSFRLLPAFDLDVRRLSASSAPRSSCGGEASSDLFLVVSIRFEGPFVGSIPFSCGFFANDGAFFGFCCFFRTCPVANSSSSSQSSSMVSSCTSVEGRRQLRRLYMCLVW